MLEGIRWILFDAVGTLIYADPPVADAYHAAGQAFGSKLTRDEIRRRFPLALAAEHGENRSTSEAHERERWRRIVANVISDVGDATNEVFEYLWQHFAQPRHWRLFDDVRPALSELRRRGFHLGIASNFDGRLHHIVQNLPELVACDAVFVSSEIGYTKPDPRFFAAVKNQLGATPSQIALVGDDFVADIQGSTAAGWRAILLDRSGTSSMPAIRTLAELSVEQPSRLLYHPPA
jgi:putative hydrolase of the HAD superfamily